MEVRVQGQEARERYGRHLHALVAPRRSCARRAVFPSNKKCEPSLSPIERSRHRVDEYTVTKWSCGSFDMAVPIRRLTVRDSGIGLTRSRTWTRCCHPRLALLPRHLPWSRRLCLLWPSMFSKLTVSSLLSLRLDETFVLCGRQTYYYALASFDLTRRASGREQITIDDEPEEQREALGGNSGRKICDCEHRFSKGVTGRLNYWTGYVTVFRTGRDKGHVADKATLPRQWAAMLFSGNKRFKSHQSSCGSQLAGCGDIASCGAEKDIGEGDGRRWEITRRWRTSFETKLNPYMPDDQDPRNNGAAVAEWLDCSPPTKANRAQSLAGPLLDFRKWESCRTMPLVGGFSQGVPVSRTPAFRRCSILTSLHPHWLSRHCCQEPPKSLNSIRRLSNACMVVSSSSQCRTAQITGSLRRPSIQATAVLVSDSPSITLSLQCRLDSSLIDGSMTLVPTSGSSIPCLHIAEPALAASGVHITGRRRVGEGSSMEPEAE
ncbi:hypothetical protein PR048_008701 [Dryococelus australis]|uniref:Uncharacterized protein n=1 Tax=Dryococelus australis TaxID=614101 RepID=A0ABQ9HXW1_9NEOP|nr:hypothetical protein PR048_008701 [Dryococelus australis]